MARRSKAWLLGLLAGLLCFPCVAFASLDLSGWSRFAPIEVQGSSKYKAVFLTDEVYAQAASGLVDLRVTDNDGQTVPYYIQAGDVLKEQNETLIATRLFYSFPKDSDEYFDYAVIVQPGVDPTATKLLFKSLPARNFVSQIDVYGSFDGVQWQYVGNGQIYRVDGRLRNEFLLPGVRKFAYYRIGMRDNINGLAPGEIKLVYAENRFEWSRYERSFTPAFEVRTEQQETTITLRNPNKLRLKRINFDVPGNFQRNYSLYEVAKPTTVLQSGEIYNLQFSGVNIANKGITLTRQLFADTIVVKVNNRDDRPLDIKGITADYYVDKLVFQDLGGGPYRLYYGNPKAEKTRYELALQRTFIEKELQDNCPLQTSQENKATPKSWLTIPDSYLLNGSIVLVSLVLIYILVPKLISRK